MIAILTDFGTQDNFVGVMKGVMLRIAPAARLIDLTHQIPPQGVREAAYSLFTARPYLPKGCVVLVVVDPGVGGSRRAVGVKTDWGLFIAPDNGVLSYVLDQEASFQAVELADPAYHLPEVSTTFHGRDIFSPAAAHLAAGVDFFDLGPEIDDLVRLPSPRLEIREGLLTGEVLSVDHFGNLSTSFHTLRWIEGNQLKLNPLWQPRDEAVRPVMFSPGAVTVEVGDLSIQGIKATFSEVEVGQPLALIGSEHTLDLAINQGNLARDYDLKVGDRVTLRY